MADKSQFDFGWEHEFPPFYTPQVHATTLKKQIDTWCDLILRYCESRKLHSTDVDALMNTELCTNKQLKRKLERGFLIRILDELARRGQLSWTNAKNPRDVKPEEKVRCKIVWRSAADWGALIYDYVSRTSQLGTVLTVFELLEGDETAECEFHAMDRVVFDEAISVLQRNGKAEQFNVDGAEGVKFFK